MTWTDEKTEKAQCSLPVKVLEQMNKIPPLQRCRLSSYILGCGHLSAQLSHCIRCLDAFFLVTHTWAQHENPHCQRDTAHVAYNQISRHRSLCDSPEVLRDWLPCQRSDFLALSSCSRGLAFQKSLASPIHPVHQAHSPGNSIPAWSSLCFSSTCSKWGHHLLFPLQTQALTHPHGLRRGCPAPFWAEPAGTRYLNFHAVSPCLLGSPLLFFFEVFAVAHAKGSVLIFPRKRMACSNHTKLYIKNHWCDHLTHNLLMHHSAGRDLCLRIPLVKPWEG